MSHLTNTTESDFLLAPERPDLTPPFSSPQTTKSKSSTLLQAFLPKHICLPSKSAMIILMWTLVIGAINGFATYGSIVAGLSLRFHIRHIFFSIVTIYAIMAMVLLLYPLAGFLADVCWGRYRTVIASLGFLCVSFGILTVCTVIFVKTDYFSHHGHKTSKFIFGTLVAVSFLLFATGLAGYKANFIQLGLDQLMEAPSRYLGLFVHWVAWFYALGSFIVAVPFILLRCHLKDVHITNFVSSLPAVFFVLLILLLVFSLYNRKKFYSEPGQHNPYKTVLKVLNYARKHKYPIKRNVTSCDDERPMRVDFAKEGYGGPFVTEQVEDVKTFIRILTVLLSLGLIFVLEVPTSQILFPLFGLHTGQGNPFEGHNCTARWAVLESGLLKHMVGVVFFPVYIWVIYSALWKITPRIFNRLTLGIVVYIAGAISMLIIDVVGHVHHSATNGDNSNQCMFAITFHKGDHYKYTPLQQPWWVLLFPSILLGVGPLLVNITTLEFISAQSPHSMKGLLVGVFFAIKGCSQLASAFIVFPFSNEKTNKYLSCGSGYFLTTILIALLGLVLYSIAAKLYKYRQRGDPPYSQHIVEKVYQHYIANTTSGPKANGKEHIDYGSLSTSSTYSTV